MKLRQLVPVVSILFSVVPIAGATAQVIPDNTLGNEGSVIAPIDRLRDRIEGGAIRGNNLFHSFQEFNIDEGQTIHFVNPAGIENILTRVTGSNPSNILGTLGVSGDANLFLLNPNGIFFGANARLDIRGSFFASTASEIGWGTDGLFSATNPRESNLLNIDRGAIFTNALANHLAAIDNRGSLEVGTGQTLTLQGEIVTLTGNLAAPEGRVEVSGNTITIGESTTSDTPTSLSLNAIDVLWQSHNDITVNSDIIGTDETNLTLQAGRSISIAENRTISLDNGNFIARINRENTLAERREDGTAQFVMKPGSKLLTRRGNIEVNRGTFGNVAIGEVRLDGSTVRADSGDIFITGTGGDGGSENYGIHLFNEAIVETGDRGTINLMGTAGSGTSFNAGIAIEDEGTRVSSAAGTINIQGVGGDGTEFLNIGIWLLENGRIESDTGNIILTGRGGNGTRSNQGIDVNHAAIYSAGGTIELIGEGGGDGDRTVGVNLVNNSLISTAEAGGITINGRGGKGSAIDNYGVYLLRGARLESLGTGAINLTGIGAGESSGIRLEESAINPTGIGRGEIAIQAETIDLQASEIRGTGSLRLEQINPETHLNLNLNNSVLGNLENGFDRILIGSENSSGTLTLTGTLAANDPVIIQSPRGDGAIASSDATLVGFDNTTFTLLANQNITLGNIYNPDGLVTINSIMGTVDSSGSIVIDQNDPADRNTPTPLIPDGSLGAENSRVVPINATTDRIEGGATRGSTLLHSFEQFNIGVERSVYFKSDRPITTIISRVTGNDPSDIFGTVGVEGNANLFLLNPNGTFFAPGATLDLNGSFVTTSANAIRLENGELFSSNPTDRVPAQILNVNPQALLFSRQQTETDGAIANQSHLEVNEGQSLLLIGGNVLVGGNFLNTFPLGASLNAPGGRVELGGLAEAGEIGLEIDGSQLQLNFPDTPKTDVSILNGGAVNVAAGGGGDITISGRNVDVAGVSITSNPSLLRGGLEIDRGSANAKAGDITINATGTANISTSGPYLSAQTLDSQPNSYSDENIRRNEISGGVVVNSLRRGSRGNAGNINIQASHVNISGPEDSCCLNRANRVIQSILWPGNQGNAGNITVQADSIELNEVMLESSNRSGNPGNAGNILLEATDEFRAILSGVQTLINGDILFNNELYGADFNSAGNAGDITIRADRIFTEDGSFFDASNQGDSGDTGQISFHADSMELILPFIRTAIAGEGNSSSINFQGTSIKMGRSDRTNTDSGGLIEAQTFGNSRGSDINIRGESVVIDNDVRLSTETLGSGDGGDINIDATTLEIAHAATVGASSQAEGNAGSIDITADDISISGASDARVTALLSVADASGSAGNITVNARNFQIAEGAALNTRTSGEGTGGNITVNAHRFEALSGGQLISVTLGEQKAGNIIVNAEEMTLNGFDPTFAERTEGIVRDTLTAREKLAAENQIRSERRGTVVNNQFTIVGPASGLFAGTLEESAGDGGAIAISTRQLTISDTAEISVDTVGSGTGGNIEIGSEIIRLQNRGDINAATLSGLGGNINIQTQQLQLGDRSNISTNAGGVGNGGDIRINAETITGLEESAISANAVEGRGGNIQITASGVFFDRLSQITATSERGIDGTIEINNQLDPTSGLVDLNANFIDAEALFARNPCAIENDRIAGGSSFIMTGRGGLHPSPHEPLTRITGVVEWANRNNEVETEIGDLPLDNERVSRVIVRESSPDLSTSEIQQAHGWIQLADGTIILTASPVNNTSIDSSFTPPTCSEFSEN